MMKVDLKEILKNSPVGTQDYLFHKLNEISKDIKENVPGTDPKIWILAYNLKYFSENMPIRRYLAYNEHPQRYNLDQSLLPYVKVVRAYARMSESQKEDFQNRIRHPVIHQVKPAPIPRLNSNQKD